MSIRYQPSSWGFRLARAFAVVVLVAVVAAAAQAKPRESNNLSRCNSRKTTCVLADVQPPTVSIIAPTDGSSAAPGSLLVLGTAADNVKLSKVEVAVAGGSFIIATGTSSWSVTLDTSTVPAGTAVVVARATDTTGNVGSAKVEITIAAPEASPTPPSEPTADPTPEPTPAPATGELGLTDSVLVNPAVSQDLVPFGKGRMATDGGRTLLLYHTEFAQEPWIYVKDRSTGASTHIRLPYDTVAGWGDASYLWEGEDLSVLSGGGPVIFRRYRLTGTPLPTAATLVSTRALGDVDSRPGDLIRLSSGSLVGVWHQQGKAGPQGHRFFRRTPEGSWSFVSAAFVPTSASKDVLVQHPADGSVWLFSNADSWSSIAAARLVETASSLAIDWLDGEFIDSRYGEFDADPENPALAVAADPSTGEVVLAYQSATRHRFSATVIGSYPVVARIAADGSKRFSQLKLWSERVARLGLIVVSGQAWLAHRVIDPATLRFDRMSISRLVDGTWTTAEFGVLAAAYVPISYASSTVQVAARMSDGRIHWFE